MSRRKDWYHLTFTQHKRSLSGAPVSSLWITSSCLMGEAGARASSRDRRSECWTLIRPPWPIWALTGHLINWTAFTTAITQVASEAERATWNEASSILLLAVWSWAGYFLPLSSSTIAGWNNRTLLTGLLWELNSFVHDKYSIMLASISLIINVKGCSDVRDGNLPWPWVKVTRYLGTSAELEETWGDHWVWYPSFIRENLKVSEEKGPVQGEPRLESRTPLQTKFLLRCELPRGRREKKSTPSSP